MTDDTQGFAPDPSLGTKSTIAQVSETVKSGSVQARRSSRVTPGARRRSTSPVSVTSKTARSEMIRLTTYLGHSDPSNTYWYLEAVPELLDLAMARATADGQEAVQ